MSLPDRELLDATPQAPETTGEVLAASAAPITPEITAETIPASPTLSTPAAPATATVETTAATAAPNTPFTDQEAVQRAGQALKSPTAADTQDAIATIRDHYRQASQD